jgi:hypothetical protein
MGPDIFSGLRALNVFNHEAALKSKEELRSRSELVPAGIAESYNGPDAHLDKESLANILDGLAAQCNLLSNKGIEIFQRRKKR